MARITNRPGTRPAPVYDPAFALFTSDEHAGHRLGLCDPDVLLLDTDGRAFGPPVLETQRYLWELREEMLAKALAVIGGHPFGYFQLGDITHGDKYPAGLMGECDCAANQFKIATANTKRIAGLPNCVFTRLISGTGAHIYGRATSELTIAAMLQSELPGKDIRVLSHAKVSLPGGVVFDLAHHGPGAGIRQWTRGNVARQYLKSAMWQDFKAGRQIPRLFVRGHYHTWVHEMFEEWFLGEIVPSDLIVMPSWCGMTEFGRQATASQYEVFHGLLLAEIRGGELQLYPFVEPFDIRVDDPVEALFEREGVPA